MKITVITAVTKGYDKLEEHSFRGNANYIAFVQDKFESSFFTVKDICNNFKEASRNAKIHKILMHKYSGSSYLTWLDANISLTVDPEILVKEFLNDCGNDIAVFKHPHRDCVYREGQECIKYKKDDKNVILNHLKRYREKAYPENNGLAECGAIIRRNSPEINELCEKWWSEISVGSLRDQISFPFVFSEYGYGIIDGNVRNHKYFNYEVHK